MLIGGEFIKGNFKFKPEKSTDFIFVEMVWWDIVITILMVVAIYFLIRYIRKRLSK